MTQAERQARYRERVWTRAPKTAEAAVARIRQAIFVDAIKQAQDAASSRDAEDVERDVTFL